MLESPHTQWSWTNGCIGRTWLRNGHILCRAGLRTFERLLAGSDSTTYYYSWPRRATPIIRYSSLIPANHLVGGLDMSVLPGAESRLVESRVTGSNRCVKVYSHHTQRRTETVSANPQIQERSRQSGAAVNEIPRSGLSLEGGVPARDTRLGYGVTQISGDTSAELVAAGEWEVVPGDKSKPSHLR